MGRTKLKGALGSVFITVFIGLLTLDSIKAEPAAHAGRGWSWDNEAKLMNLPLSEQVAWLREDLELLRELKAQSNRWAQNYEHKIPMLELRLNQMASMFGTNCAGYLRTIANL